MKNHILTMLSATVVVLVVGQHTVLDAQTTSQVSVDLLPNGTLLIEGTPGNDLITVFARRLSKDTIQVEALPTQTWDFPASDVIALKIATGDGEDQVIVRSQIECWTLTNFQIDLGPGDWDGASLGVNSPAGDSNALIVLEDVKAQGGAFKLVAGSEIGESVLTVCGNYTATGDEWNNSLGFETEFPSGTVIVEGDVRLKGGDGEDYIEINANGTVHVLGDFRVSGQADGDLVWLGGQTGGVIWGTSRFDGGEGYDTLEFFNFTAADLVYKKFEVVIEVP